MKVNGLLFALLANCAFAVLAQDRIFLDPPGGAQPLMPKRACASLRGLTGLDLSVVSAEHIPASAQGPDHCLVREFVQPALEIEVAMPERWNLRFQMAGNGGFGGDSPSSPAKIQARGQSLRRGFAFTAHNTGHDNKTDPQAQFAKERQKLIDWGFRSLHVTVEVSRRLMLSYYGSAPVRSYYAGCSGGGRQGLILAQRFPEDFDGIAVTAPFLNVTGQMLRYACDGQALMAAPVSAAKQGLLARKIYELCDAKDGLKDGVIDDPRACDFDPARDLPHCAPGDNTSTCFTGGELSTLKTMYSEEKLSNGASIPPWPVSAELNNAEGSGWASWRLIGEESGKGPQMALSFFQFAVANPANPDWTLNMFHLQKDASRIQALGPIVDALDADLSAFRDRGGKLLLAQGWADQALNPFFTIEYYRSLQKWMGASTDRFSRFYLVPGMYHCGGGPGVGLPDLLSVVIRWVEAGEVPGALIGKHSEGGKVTRTRPICVFPSKARYKGDGNVDDAANFTCVE